ncbi:MAG: dipeptidase [Corynebacteriales bacterium]|nr:dipeptidase [Mycobacteriales bacterium]
MMPNARQELSHLVSFQSVAGNNQFPTEESAKAAEWILTACRELGLNEGGLYPAADGTSLVIASRQAPPGAPTVLLYSHYDVQPPLDAAAWHTPPFTLTERDNRWYGRGTADCKGGVMMNLLALRALGRHPNIGITMVVEGSEELGSPGLVRFVRDNPDLVRADAILICDGGNAAVGQPTLTTSLRGNIHALVTVRALQAQVHSGMFGGAAPDPLAALTKMLAGLWDKAGNVTIRGLDNAGIWEGAEYPTDRFRREAGVLADVDLLGDNIANQVWARPSLTILGIDCPSVQESVPVIQAQVRARLGLRVPPGIKSDFAYQALADQLTLDAPWNVRVEVEHEASGQPFTATQGGPAYAAMQAAMRAAYGTETVTQGQGASIPVCTVFAEQFPDAEIMLMGLCEPEAMIHAPNESLDPTELENMAVAEALFLASYGHSR